MKREWGEGLGVCLGGQIARDQDGRMLTIPPTVIFGPLLN